LNARIKVTGEGGKRNDFPLLGGWERIKNQNGGVKIDHKTQKGKRERVLGVVIYSCKGRGKGIKKKGGKEAGQGSTFPLE